MKVLKHFVLQSSRLQPQRVHKRAQAVPQQIKFCFPVEVVPLGQQLFAVTQFSFPLLPPIAAQTARHDHADQRDQPEAEPREVFCCVASRCHRVSSLIVNCANHTRRSPSNYSCRSAITGFTFTARRAGIRLASSATTIIISAMAPKTAGSVGSTVESRFLSVC